MTDILLVRHGQTDWNLDRRIQGQSDIQLNSAGLAQAESFASGLTDQHYDLLISSDLQRAVQTARIIAARLSLPVHCDQRLREVDHGDWEGMLISDVLQQFGKEYTAFRNEPEHSRAPGGETLNEAFERVTSVIEENAIQFPAGRILVVSHGLVIALLRCKVNGLPFNMAHQFGLDNCAGDLIHWSSSLLHKG